jgi:2-oxo-3-hexenedioate decarboxylase
VEKSNLQKMSEYLLNAEAGAVEVSPLAESLGKISIAEAYEVQTMGLLERLQKGAHQCGWKMGLTSIAKRQQMRLEEAIYGYLLEERHVKGREFSLSKLIHPKVEPEIGFRTRSEIRGALTFEEALECIESVCAALEIIDSRYKGFKYFSLPDVIADNCSASFFKFGEEVKFSKSMPLDTLEMLLSINNHPKEKAKSSEISGHPVQSLVQLSEMLARSGKVIAKGSLILAGAATPAVSINREDFIELKVESLPSVSLKMST